MDDKERFISLLRATGREGIEDLIEWYSNKTDFFTAPASSRYHGAAPGMLCRHSLNVYDAANIIADSLEAAGLVKVDRTSLAITTLNHDACKAEFYTPKKKKRQNPQTGVWEFYDSYEIDEKFCFGGHGSKSVFLVQHFIKLTPEEGVAINCHMGAWDGNEYVGNAFTQFPLAWIVHVADEMASYIYEKE